MSAVATDSLRRPFYLDRGGERLFAIHHPAQTKSRPSGGVVFFAPFAEELNRTRRMTTLLAQALAAAGAETLVFDYSCTGDSTGDFGDARVEGWIEDGAAAIDWLAEKTDTPVAIVGLRLGAALALLSAERRPRRVEKAVLWQAVTSGSTMLTQFLRLRIAASMGAEGTGETTKSLRERLGAGETLEVGGYSLGPDLFQAIDGISLSRIRPPAGLSVQWLEVSPDENGDLSVPGRRIVDGWRDAGTPVAASTVSGDPFWSTVEMTTAPVLIEATVAAVAGERG